MNRIFSILMLYCCIVLPIFANINTSSNTHESIDSNTLSNPPSSIPDYFQPLSLIAPLLPLSKEVPVSLSIHNQRKYIDNRNSLSYEVSQTQNVISSKSLPWNLIQALIAIFFFYLLIKMPNGTTQTKKTSEVTTSTLRTKAIYSIQQIKESSSPKENTEQVPLLDHILRYFIEEYHQIHAPTLTTQEFLKIASRTSSIDNESRDLLESFLTLSDQIKFAQHKPTEHEFSELIETAIQFVNNSHDNN